MTLHLMMILMIYYWNYSFFRIKTKQRYGTDRYNFEQI